MKRSIGVTAVALALLFTGAFLSPFVSNPFASNSLNMPSERAPILLNANGTRISLVPSTGIEGNAAPVVINVGSTTPSTNENALGQPVQAAYRPVVRSAAYESAPQPRRITRSSSNNSETRSWQKEAVIIGGGAAAGAGIGVIAGGKKGAAIGAISGGVAGLVYDMKTRKSGDRW